MLLYKWLIDLVKSLGYIVIFPFETLYDFITKLSGGLLKKPKKAGRPTLPKNRYNAVKDMYKRVLHKLRAFFKPKVKVKKAIKPKKIIWEKNRKKYGFPVFVGGVLFSIVFVFVPFETYKWFEELPDTDIVTVSAKNHGSTKIYDRKERLLYEIYVDKNYSPVKLTQIPKSLVDATLAVEDSLFYFHHGVRVDSIVRAARSTFIVGEVQGGSTITQQLVKNVLLNPEQTFSRKLKEAVLSLMVEKKYSKDQILELYLNNIAYGGNAWGAQSASQKYFGKNVWELSLGESSLLAGLPSSPTTYSPFSDVQLAKQRQRYVLDRMVELKYVTPEEADQAFAEELVFAEQKEFIKAPHFVYYVIDQLQSQYGDRYVKENGLTVITSLDLDLQEEAQEIVKEEVDLGLRFGFSNGASVIMDSKTSEILAYVGSVDFFKEKWGAYDVALAYRQPGSAIKPVTYALALASGLTPASIIKDSPVTYHTAGSKPYSPVNYDGRYHGNVTLRAALANSYNIPAVRLAREVGADSIVSLGRDMGLKNWSVGGDYGLAVTLGGKEVRLIDLVNVYATFARKGFYQDPVAVLSVKDGKGTEVYNSKTGTKSPKSVISEEVSYLIWSILSDNNARVPAFGSRNALVIPNHTVAVKTGTTDNKKDNWTVGFTPSYVVGVWVGNNDGKEMNQNLASGLTGAAPIWNRLMTTVLEGTSNELFTAPEGVFVKSDSKCGRSEVFIKGSKVPQTLCPPEVKKDEDKNKDD